MGEFDKLKKQLEDEKLKKIQVSIFVGNLKMIFSCLISLKSFCENDIVEVYTAKMLFFW